MAARIRGVIFDLDGTLVDSMPQVLRAYAEAIAPFQARVFTPVEIMACLGGPPEVSLRNLLGGDRHVAAALARLDEYFVRHRHELVSFPGARELLAELHTAGVWTGLWTGRDRASTDELLAHFDLAPFLNGTVCGDDLPSHKPDPAGLSVLFERAGLTAAETLFVGDAGADVVAARQLGMRMLLIDHGTEIAAEVRALATEIVNTPAVAYDRVRAAVAPARTAPPRISP